MKAKASGPAYLQVLKQLQELIAREYEDGGFLQTSKVMSRKMGVTHVTYNKAIARLIIEGIARSNRKAGTYISPKESRPKKIGIIIGNAEEASFIGSPQTDIVESIRFMQSKDYGVQIITAGKLKNIGDQLVLHGIKAALWFEITEACLPIIEAIQKNLGIAFIAVNVKASALIGKHKQILTKINYVSYDLCKLFIDIAKLCKENQYRSVLYFGSKKIAEKYSFQQEVLKFADFSCIEGYNFSSTQLTNKLKNNRVDLIFCEGGNILQENLFNILSALPPEVTSPDVILRDVNYTAILKKKYPTVNIIAQATLDVNAQGEKAASMMYEFLENGSPIQSMLIPEFKLNRLK